VSTSAEHVRTILFTDVEGSTQLRSRHGDQFADDVLHVHETIVRRLLDEHGGQEMAFLGDGFLASFRSPVDGLRCALGIQRELEAHSEEHPDREVRVRIGLHQGEATERDGTLYGQAVHAAARIMSEAAGGRILVSSWMKDHTSEEVDAAFVDRGLYWLKGFPERWRLYEVDWGKGASAQPPVGEGPARAPFVDRQDSRADLRRAVHGALGGRGSLVLVTGEPGVGKTRLTTEVCAEAETRGMRVLVGHCAEMEGGTPFLPFVEILEQALIAPRSPAALRERLGDAGPELARMAPWLRRVVPDLPPPLDLPPEQARRYLFLSVQEFAERAAHDRPLLLVLEDLHWADESSLLLLEYLTPQLSEMSTLIIGTYRDREVGPSHPLARILGQLVRRRLGIRVALHRLAEDDVGAMVRGLAGQEAPRGLLHAINAESEGNPFFVEEVYLHLAESGVLLDERGRFRADLRIDELDVPESVRLVIGGRLARLSEAARTALIAAAPSGRVFEVEVVSRVAGLPPDALADALDESERAGLIAPVATDGTRLAFVHELFRQTVLAGVSSTRRQRLHARTAEALEQVHAADRDEHAADLAYHLSRSGPDADAPRLVRYLRIAADRAVQASAFGDAVAHLDHAVAIVPADDRHSRAELLERLALALRSVGRWDDALRTMDESLALYQELGRTDAVGRLCMTMSYQLGWAARWQEAFLVANRGLAALGNLPTSDRARLLASAAWVVGLGGDHDTAAAMFAEARSVAEQLRDDRALADVLHLETIHHLGYAELAEGVETGLRAAEVFDAQGALWELAGVLGFVVYLAGARRHHEQASTLAQRAGPLAERIGHLGAQFLTLADRIRTEAVFPGDLSAVEAIARDQLTVCERGALPWICVARLYLGLAAYWRGDWDAAERELRLAVELEPPGVFGGQFAAQLAIYLASAGRPSEVLAIVEERRAGLPVAGRKNGLGTWNTLLGFTEALYLIGRTEEAAAFLPLILEALDLGEEWVALDGRLIRTRAGIAAAAGGRWEEAERHYLAVLELAGANGYRIEEADAHRLYARMLIDRDRPGDRERARNLLHAAIRTYEDLDMPGFVAMADALLADAA
jgi:class 3 adenylate cyclase/tetratricopeptide (TPR) repeat protein